MKLQQCMQTVSWLANTSCSTEYRVQSSCCMIMIICSYVLLYSLPSVYWFIIQPAQYSCAILFAVHFASFDLNGVMTIFCSVPLCRVVQGDNFVWLQFRRLATYGINISGIVFFWECWWFYEEKFECENVTPNTTKVLMCSQRNIVANRQSLLASILNNSSCLRYCQETAKSQSCPKLQNRG